MTDLRNLIMCPNCKKTYIIFNNQFVQGNIYCQEYNCGAMYNQQENVLAKTDRFIIECIMNCKGES